MNATELGNRNEPQLEGHPGGRKLDGLWRATEWRSPRRKSWVVGSRPRRPGDRAPHPKRSVRRASVRRTYKLSADDRSHRRVGSTRYGIPRETAHLVTGGPTTDPLLAKDGSHPARVAKATRVGVHLATGDEGVLREGRVRHLASQGAGDGSTVPRLRLRGPAAGALSGELAAKGREAWGAAERGHGQDARRTWLKRPRTRAGGWRTKRS